MYNLQYDHDGRLMLVKIEEVCVFSPKALDDVIARLRTLRDKAWHDWHAERHDPRALKWWSAMAGCRDCTPRARWRSRRRRIARRSRPAGRSGGGGAD